MASLRTTQSGFVLDVARLIEYAYEQGYELTFGDAWATKGHSANSNHYRRLAIDLNLFKDGEYLMETSDHASLGAYWEGLCPANRWGGHFRDGNHYERRYP